ncbi:MAG TPA: hypothetical protein VGB06_08745 [Solirubrobacterales bacterium]|jgi:hypothetical protein
MRGRLLIAAAVALIGLVFAVGCGDDEETTANNSSNSGAAAGTNGGESGGGETTDLQAAAEEAAEGDPEKEEFIVQANELCKERVKEVQDKGQKVFKEVFKLPGKVAAKKLAHQVIVPIFTTELQELEELDQPPGDEKELEAIYSEIQGVIDYMSGNPQPSVYPYTKGEKLADKYGIGECATPQ